MKTAGIVAEFNPFHNGHKRLIKKARALGFDAIVTVMSGDIVQRGEISIISRHLRAEAAVLSGADLVLELPYPFSCSCAEIFSKAAVGILKRAKIDALIFGSEITDKDALLEAARFSAAVGEDSAVRELLARGESYPKAVAEIADGKLSKAAAAVLKSPNATLGLEYIKALDGTPFFAVDRNVSHDGDLANGDFASALEIRNRLEKGEDVSAFCPMNFENLQISSIKRVERALIFDIIKKGKNALLEVPDINEELSDRLSAEAFGSGSFDELIQKTKTKAYTAARIKRCVINSFLGVTAEDLTLVPYIRPLAANERGLKVLSEIDGGSPSLKKLFESYPRLCELSALSAELFDTALNRPTGISEYSRKFLRV